MSMPAPVAPMMASSSSRPFAPGRLQPVSNRSTWRGRPSGLFSPPRTRSNGKEPQDFQAQVDRTEMARDEADPDYRLSQETPRKRRAASDISPRSAKKKSPGHIPFDNVKTAESKSDRQRHLVRIRDNWGEATEQWMPGSLWPYKVLRLGGGRKRKDLIPDPRDWNGPLLEELSYLSAVTKNRPGDAYKALEDAVSQRQDAEDDHDDTQVLKEDVQDATQICKAADPSRSSPVPADEAEEAPMAIETSAIFNEGINGLPTIRSPTIARDEPVIKVESQPASAGRAVDSFTDKSWSGYEDAMEKLQEAKLEAEENEAIAAAKRAQREQIQQRRRLRELMRQHGRTRDDAIVLGSEETGS